MATWFLIIIYLAFISLGLPDSLLGSAWPVIWPDIGASFGSAGILSMVVAGGTIVSSLASGSLIQRLGTGKVTLISCCLTAGALLGFSVAPSMIWLVLLAIPLGLGAGAVDAALNHYVAENYNAYHMNWLHCFWGAGATMGPIIMSAYIAGHHSWRGGYAAISMVQFGLVIILFVTLPLWKSVAARRELEHSQNEVQQTQVESVIVQPNGSSKANVLRIKGVKYSLIAFLFYCGVETTVGLWGATYLVGAGNIAAETAAGWISLYYGGITVGRLVTGFITMKVHNRVLIRCGQIVAIAGGIILLLPLSVPLSLIGFILIGLGLAPVYPGLLHETPARFGRENSARLMGYQMAAAYTGTTFLPPLFGIIATQTDITLFPFVVLAFLIFMMLSAEKINRILSKQEKARI
ncbi:MFS transporter [Paenibacillus macerans]|uniref:Major Facilitator Superfamily protein n=1 Tax=Paenibacillus macerans TaxID=44252 RepID=A0A090ZP20_PAEMA|nr:MFS transporter [Paenibacillus macerans]KFN12372.1 major Facilitator Superfamily protein [Paenibacillus macerans]MEC0150402.1 MFS transporter [Paenibacillus macerans]SUA84254.1 bypass of stop codon protein 6 [Paenibacillus macerans]